MKTDYDDYKRANKIKESWPEKTPLALRDKIFIALIALLVVVPVVHVAISYSGLAEEILPLGGGGLRDSDPKWMLLVLALCDVIVAVALIATIVFPRPDFLADELLQRPAEEIIRGMRFFCGAFGVIAAVFLAASWKWPCAACRSAWLWLSPQSFCFWRYGFFSCAGCVQRSTHWDNNDLKGGARHENG